MLELPHTLESRALLHALDNDPFWNMTLAGGRPAALSLSVQAEGLGFDALPVNATILVQMPNVTEPLRVAIPPGEGTFLETRK